MSSATNTSATPALSLSAPPKKRATSESKWGDDMYDDDEKPVSSSSSQALFSPAVQTTLKPGVHTVEEFYVNNDKKKVKVIRKVKVVAKQVKVNKNVLRRRGLPKFGDAASAPPGPEENVTYLSNEVISLDLRPKRREEKENDGGFNLDKLQQSRCRNCGEVGHWTLKCPKRAEIKVGGAAGEREREELEAAAAAASGGAGGRYVPPAARHRGVRGLGGPGADRDRDDNLSVRVTNLSEDTTEADVRELFERIGRVSRIFLAKDRMTGLSRGFAFVSFYERRAAEEAIAKLNGHGYDNLILHVEWAKPREPDANRERDGASVMGGPRG